MHATAVTTFARPLPESLQDGPLMQAVAAGDLDAFSVLYDRHAARVYGTVQRVLRDPSQSEEVAQEVFVEAWRLAARFQEHRGRLDGWLMTMARRRAIDRVRSEQAARDRGVKAAALSQTRPMDEVAAQVMLLGEYDDVRRAMEVLSDAQRHAIDRAYFGGLTYAEVAEELRIPLSTVKTRIRDGLARLRSELRAHDPCVAGAC